MPSTVDAAGRRKVRCPKCTALLKEPQTQIYECPICFTLLLAKGNLGGKSWENRVHKSGGDADDIQQIFEGGSKLEKAILINESSNDQLQQNVEAESNVDFDARSSTSQESHVLSDLNKQSLSGISFSKPKSEPVDDLAPKNNALAPDTPPDTPHRRKPLHVAEILRRSGSGHRLSELDSVSHSESEVDVDSPIWSSENANNGEGPEVFSSFDASSHVDGSSEHLSNSRPSLSSGAVVTDGAQSLQKESELEMRIPSDGMSFVSGANETEHKERHRSHEVANEEEDSTVEERRYLESRIGNSVVPVVTNSGKSVLEEGHKLKDANDGEVAKLVGSTGVESSQSNPVDSTPKEGIGGDSKQGKAVEISKVGKFGLFDLSVFGIYSEDTYSELRRGKAAHYPKLSENGSDGEGEQSTVDGDLTHKVTAQSSSRDPAHEAAVQSSSHEQDCTVENIAEIQTSLNVPESSTNGTHFEAGIHGKVPLKVLEQEDTDVRSSGLVGQEFDEGGNVTGGDVGLLLNSSVDSDVIANARYGDHLGVKDMSLEMASSIDISFGDWRLQQVVKPPQKSFDQAYVGADSVYEKGMLDLAAEEDTDSSWDDEEELTFSSASKDSKLKGASEMDKEAQALRSTRRSISRSRAKTLLENPAFPFRTTAMQKFLQRNEQEGTVPILSQESIKADSELYEAPYVEHYTPPVEKHVHEAAYKKTTLVLDDTPFVKGDKPQIISVPQELEDRQTKVMDGNSYSADSTHISSVRDVAVPPTPSSRVEENTQTVLTEGTQSRKDLTMGYETVPLTQMGDPQSRKGFDAVRSPRRDVRVDEVDRTGMEMMDLDLQNVDNFNHGHASKAGSAPGKPVSLRWKGKVRSSTQSLSSTEDDGAYGVESEAGSGPDRDSAKKQGVGFTEGHILPVRDAQVGLGQQTRGHYQPAQRTRSSSNDVDRQKYGSGELATSRRSARSRASNARLSNQELFEQADAVRNSNPETFGRSGLDRSENVPSLQSRALNLNRSILDQGSNYLNGMADYNSDHSSRSQDLPSRTQYNENYLSKPYGLPAAGTYPFEISPHGSVPRASIQEPGFMHSAHHCVSPACSLCMQQQYYIQPPQILQNGMMHSCAACASQSSGAAYRQPMHHGAHSHHMHGSMYSNPSLRQHDSGSLPAQSRRQNRSNLRESHPLPPARRAKLYPPLPGKDAPPYVLCKHCNQLLQVPGYLPPISGPIQKLQCGSCEKISKFCIPLQAVSPSANKNLWVASSGLAMHVSDNLLARDKRHTDMASIHSSDQGPSSGLATSAQNLYGVARHTRGHGSQQERAENRMFLQSSASGIAQTETAVSRQHARPMTGGVPEQYRTYGRNVESDHLHNSTGIYSEGYLSSSPSSPTGSTSPGRPPQISRHHQQIEPVRQRRPGFGERESSPDSPTLSTTVQRPPFEAPNFSDDFFQKGSTENRSRYSTKSLQGPFHDPYSHDSRHEHLARLQQASKAGSWHNQPADTDYSGRNVLRSQMEQRRIMPVAPGSPLIEHFSQDAEDGGPPLEQRYMLQNSANDSGSVPWSPASGSPLSPLVDSLTKDSVTDFSERSYDRERLPLPVQDASKGPKSFAGLFKRSLKGGQGGTNRRKVIVNGHFIQEADVRKAEELAGAIHSGSYWYDYQAGFWGVLGGPCLGILMPFIEEFHFPLARDCAGGTTGILVNGRELHEKDLEVLAKRGMPTMSGKAYILDISGALFDDVTRRPLRGLGKLAPSIEKKGRGFGMSQFTAQP